MRILFLKSLLSLVAISGYQLISRTSTVNTLWNVTCLSNYQDICPLFQKNCARIVIDGAFEDVDVQNLHKIAQKGMINKTLGGPTILDINTGFVRDSGGLENLFMKENSYFTSEEFEIYGTIIRKLKHLVSTSFGFPVHFTTPTFITRLDGSSSWQPREIHDEYWHIHADMNNTAHYHFSGLLYMSDYEKDFTGGRVLFYPSSVTPFTSFEEADPLSEQIIEPRAGRIVMFSSGQENPHRVERLLSGQRYVLAFWFTCDPDREFEIFLDGNAHIEFSRSIKSRLEQQQKQSEHQKSSKYKRRGSRSRGKASDNSEL